MSEEIKPIPAKPIDYTGTYDPPEKYKGKKNAHGQLVGQRIDPETELGKELVKLRISIHAAAHGHMASHKQDEDMARRVLEVSQNVPAPVDMMKAKQYRAQRATLIRKRMQTEIDKIVAAHGRPPTSIGIPKESYDEVKEACWDFDVTFVPEG